MFKYRNLILWLATAVAFAGVQTAFAKSVTMYDQPQANAKVIGTIDSSSQMVPIFTSKAGDWMKIGNPKNGDVGWVKVTDLGGGKGTGFSFTQQTVNTADGPKTTIQFGVPQEMTPEQLKDLQKRQADFEKSIQKMVNDVYKDFNGIYTNPVFYPQGQPFLIPVVVMPQQVAAPTPPAPPAAAPVAAPAVPAATKPADTQ